MVVNIINTDIYKPISKQKTDLHRHTTTELSWVEWQTWWRLFLSALRWATPASQTAHIVRKKNTSCKKISLSLLFFNQPISTNSTRKSNKFPKETFKNKSFTGWLPSTKSSNQDQQCQSTGKSFWFKNCNRNALFQGSPAPLAVSSLSFLGCITKVCSATCSLQALKSPVLSHVHCCSHCEFVDLTSSSASSYPNNLRTTRWSLAIFQWDAVKICLASALLPICATQRKMPRL